MLDTEIFIKKAQNVHNGKYYYYLVDYKNGKIKVLILCSKHGEFLQTPSRHMAGQGCPKCAKEYSANNKSMTTENFILKAKSVHGNLYNYSMVDYKRSCIKIKIICSKHGVFEQIPNNHIRGMKCIKCANEENAKKRRSTLQEFINKAKKVHGSKYNYSVVDYVGNSVKIKIICKKHGVFEQVPSSHLGGKGCPICGRWSLLTTQKFIDRANKKHGQKFDYSLVDYKNSRIKIKIICKKHGIFEQTPFSHLAGCGCPICLESQGEKKICLFLNANKMFYIREKSFEKCINKYPLHFDFFVPELNTCIEFDGEQHFRPIDYFGGENVFKETVKSDTIKTEFCKIHGIKLIRVSYKNKDSEIISILKNNLISI